MMNFKEIISAWIISFDPTDREMALAEARGKICDACEYKVKIKMLQMPVCKECGCPIGKKIFTNSFDPCGLHKWSEIDKEYFGATKTEKTLL